MQSIVETFLAVLKSDAEQWEAAAQQCDSLIPHLAGFEQREQWKATAEHYRCLARHHRELIQILKKEHSIQ